MSEFRFAEPGLVHLTWVVLVFAGLLVWLDRGAGRALERLVSPLLQRRLVERPGRAQRRLRIGLLTAAGLFGVLALMRPQWGLEFVSTPRTSAELMVALDVSRSMLAEDVAPSRLERAKAEVRDLLGFLEGDRVGLIAFAGRASVLSPLTPDFGFFRLVLGGVGPDSVVRGGTRLEEPIRKAVEGFRASGDVSRVILLITDGEDHDSFPIEAAREAAERGIAVIAIGFGSEEGSEIPITDPETGARTLLRDSGGDVVRTRLDGDTLREIALITGGVYVPAGTGALDLESIYREHIAGLVRGKVDDRGRQVRGEAFQWPVLLALVCLVGSALVGRARGASAAAAVLVLMAAIGEPAAAQSAASEEAPPEQRVDAAGGPSPAGEGEEPGSGTPDAAPVDPRLAYNAALEEIAGRDLDRAEDLLVAARSSAGTDGEARYRASYGLGWVEAARADERLDGKPAEALAHLQAAADHFREAVRLRPADEDARFNLELVLRRARVLADSLRDSSPEEIAERLDGLIADQRALAGAIRSSVDRTAEEGDGTAPGDDAERARYRGLSTEQRRILSDGDVLAADAERDRSAIEAMPDDASTPEDRMRAAQLGQLMAYLHRGRERMGHTRRELRRRRGDRAWRRASVALTELKRARDQLRDPVELLDAVIRDATELGTYTGLLATLGSGVPGAEPAPDPPAWLTVEWLSETQDGVTQRTAELHTRLTAGAAQAQQEESLEPEQARLLSRVLEAEPHVGTAVQGFERAQGALDREAIAEAFEAQREAVSALRAARELFLNLRGAIEAAWADQGKLGKILATDDAELREHFDVLARPLRELQQLNARRATRIGELLDEEEAALQDPESEQGKAERERLDLARGLTVLTESAMRGVLDHLDGEQKPIDIAAAAESSARAERGLETLRRLFLSIVELLRDTARRQHELNEATEEAAALDPANASGKLGPLAPRQAELAESTGALANALEEQSRQEPVASPDPSAPPIDPTSPEDAAALEDAADRMRRAAELTLEAQEPMESAASALGREPYEVEAARADQDQALAYLLEAIALLEPPQEDRQSGDQQDRSSQGAAEPQQGPDQEQRAPADPAQLLQGVRDRETARRQERERSKRSGYETVEKDW